ncbi:MAG: gamma carbonic anhydrase family protein [Hellea sp.]|nr:gamma carbonic anhydrase family protein [Hellea sp.]
MAIYKLGDINPKIDRTAWVAPSASVIGNVILEAESSVWFGAVLRGDNEPIKVGARSNIQDNSVLHTDPGMPLDIGEGVIVGHRVMLHGCNIGDNSLIGIGATVLNGVKIGKNCLIGAHALITENKVIPDNSMVIGAPGKVVKTLSENQIAFLKLNADVYVKNAARFAAELEQIAD